MPRISPVHYSANNCEVFFACTPQETSVRKHTNLLCTPQTQIYAEAETRPPSPDQARQTGGRDTTKTLFLKVGEGCGERAKTFFLGKKSFRPFPAYYTTLTTLPSLTCQDRSGGILRRGGRMRWFFRWFLRRSLMRRRGRRRRVRILRLRVG